MPEDALWQCVTAPPQAMALASVDCRQYAAAAPQRTDLPSADAMQACRRHWAQAQALRSAEPASW
ncbi:hypothetical protein LP419_07395 [Massilia sp. H-1]|nr:hypothetical protein LP419_07395 [Massilia sp. H-1]